MTPTRTITVCAAALTLAAGSVHAQCTPLGALAANSPASGDFFGSALAGYTSNNEERLMIGVRLDDTAAAGNAGSVYTFGRLNNNQWSFLSQITANDGQLNDYFGTSVGVADPRAVVGAPGAGVGGAAYFFIRTGPDWVQRTKATIANPVSGDDFGASVAMYAGWAIVGAPGRDWPSNTDGGAAYIYQIGPNDTWVPFITIPGNNANGLDAGSRLGSAVAMGEFVAVVGAPSYTQPNWPSQHGAIRVYRRTTPTIWELEGILTTNLPGAGDHYGAAVATDGSFIAIGAPDDDRTDAQGGALTDSGCVYIRRYANGVWSTEAQVFAPDASAGGRFGTSVAISDGRLVVGAAGAKKAYVFRRVQTPFGFTWAADETIQGPAGTSAPSSFGNAVALTGQTVAIGDELADTPSLTNSGAVYLRRTNGATGDSCGAAVEITAGTFSGCTLYAARDGSTTCGSPAWQGPDVWFAYTAACDGPVTVDTGGSSFDTVLSVHEACPSADSTNTIACNDDGGGAWGTASSLTFSAQGGAIYLIRVAGYNGAQGDFTLHVQSVQTPVPNDTCATALPVGAGQHGFNTCMASTDGPALSGCFFGTDIMLHKDVWFRYTAECTGTAEAGTCGSELQYDTLMAVYAAGACPSQTGPALTCSDDVMCNGSFGSHSRVTFATVAGQQYLIRVGGYGPMDSGAGLLTIQCTPACPADWNGNGQVNSTDISAFLTSWLQSVSAGTLTADFNHDQSVNSTDISAFLTAWLQAVQTGC